MNKLFFIAVLFIAYSCNSNNSNEVALAKVGKEYLYPSYFLGNDYTKEDVENITEVQKTDWIKKQLWYNQAKNNIEDNDQLNAKVKDYEQNVFISAYQDKLTQNVTSLVNNEDIVKYYSEHKTEFSLNENLYKIKFVVLDSEIGNTYEILTSLNNSSDNQFLSDYCIEHPDQCLLEPTWVNDDKLNSLGLPEFMRVTSTKFEQYFKDNNNVCLYRIIERKLEGEYSPLELVNKEIASIVFFNKSKEILKQQEDKLFKNAKNKQDFEIYK